MDLRADWRAYSGRRLAIFDRDGTLNRDSGYTFRVSDLELCTWAPPATDLLGQVGFIGAIASNQSGVARGIFSIEQSQSFTRALCSRLPGLDFIAKAFCVHGPRHDCFYRKPSPGLLLWLIGLLRPEEVIFVGNAAVDETAALSAEVRFFRASENLPRSLAGAFA